jgi:hypothetical protein
VLSSSNLGQTRWSEAYQAAVVRFSLEAKDYGPPLGIRELAQGEGLGHARVPPEGGKTLLSAIGESLLGHHRAGDVKPVILLSNAGNECLIAIRRFSSGTVCLVTLSFDPEVGWSLASVEER